MNTKTTSYIEQKGVPESQNSFSTARCAHPTHAKTHTHASRTVSHEQAKRAATVPEVASAAATNLHLAALP